MARDEIVTCLQNYALGEWVAGVGEGTKLYHAVSGAEVAVKLASAEMKTAGMLSPSTDVDALATALSRALDRA